MALFNSLRKHLDARYAHRGYVVHSQAVTLFYLDVFLVIFLPALAVFYALLLPQRAPIAVPPMLVISVLALITMAFVWKGRLGWAGPFLAYSCAVVVMAAQIPKLYGEYHTAFNGFTYVFVLPILIMALFGALAHIIPVAALMFGFNALFFFLLWPRLENPEHIVSAQIGWAASSAGLLIASAIIFLSRRLMDNALSQLETVNRSIRRFVPVQTLKLLDKTSVEEVQLGENREVTMAVLFADLRNFTQLTESMSSLDAFSLVNRFFGMMGPLIRNRNGYVDKYLGDGLLALFHSAEDAAAAAIDMQQAMDVWNASRHREWQGELAMGIGIHWGLLRLGTVGEADRLENTVIADAVNTASRLEGLTKVTGSRILLSQEALPKDGPTEVRLVAVAQLRGKAQTMDVYELYACDSLAMIGQKNRERDALAKAVRLFVQGEIEAAERILDAYLVRFPVDIPALHLMTQCLDIRQRTQEETLFQKYGHMEGILGIVDHFYAKITSDPDIAPYFRGANMNRLKGHQSKVLSHLMGASIQFDPQALIAYHRHLQIKPEHFEKVADYFESCLQSGGVSPEDARSLRERFATFRRYILVDRATDTSG